MFLGTHRLRLDEKGRLVLPARFRDQLDGLVVTRGQERCLFVWPAAEFRRFADARRRDALASREERGYMRMLAAEASAESPDRQGRITVTPALRRYAGLDRDCVVIGAYDRVEIWDAEAWQRYTDEQEDPFANWSAEVMSSPDG